MPGRSQPPDDAKPFVYHGTSSVHVEAILARGLHPRTCWGSFEMASYFAAVEAALTRGMPRIFARRLDLFDADTLEVDEQSVALPMSNVLGAEETTLSATWESLPATDRDWARCLRIFGSMICTQKTQVSVADLLEPGARFPTETATPHP